MPSHNAAPRLGSALIARKGEAAPTVTPASNNADTRPAGGADMQIVETSGPAHAPAAASRGLAGTIAVTVRLDPERYERLKIHGARNRRTNQDILVDALDAYFAARA
jgi:hypothetical protein